MKYSNLEVIDLFINGYYLLIDLMITKKTLMYVLCYGHRS